MTSDRWRRIEEIFHSALMRDPKDRAAYLAQACGSDADILSEVKSLLAQPQSGDHFLPSNGAVTRTVPLPTMLVGRRVGVYQVEALLGVGGMGEVYKARDTKLDRDVAIKILPELLTSNAHVVARFEREAKMLAALNHPNIGALYGFEDVDGIRALVLELVDGEVLVDRITAGPLPLNDALTIARQIADALEAAHDKGIVHRDLKPRNVGLTRDGTVKVLDFGLAKAISGDSSQRPQADAMELTDGHTREGVILGTVAYMSPEQARGRPVDKRTDIWAFGCVLYEMLAGRRAFLGATFTDTVVKVIEHDPDWTALSPSTPANIRRLLERCLAKDAKLRLRDIGDARLELDEALGPGRPATSGIDRAVPVDRR